LIDCSTCPTESEHNDSQIIMRDFLIELLTIILSPSMAARRHRRTLGTVILVLVVVLGVLGCIFLSAGVSPGTSLVWWGICFLLMTWAVYLAYIEVRSIKHDLRTQKKELFLSIFSQPGLKGKRREKGKGRSSSNRKSGEQRRDTETDSTEQT